MTKLKIPKVFWLELVIFDANNKAFDSVQDGGKDGADTVLVVVQRVGCRLTLQRRAEALQTGDRRLPRLKVGSLLT